MTKKHTKCSIDGCNEPVKARGWCTKHYTRWYKHGDTETVIVRSGKNNPMYKHGRYCQPCYCKCGAEKDHRSSQCAVCAGTSFPVGQKNDGYSKFDISEEKIEDVIAKSKNYVQASVELNISRNMLMDVLAQMNPRPDTSHFSPGRGRPVPTEEILVENSPVLQGTLRKRILEENILEYRCSKCQLGSEWNGLPLLLEIHHINGNNRDNRIENLAMLCPNCHSQTANYKGWKR